MSPTLFRLLAVLTLALILPLQGVAAVSAGVCMALGHHHPGAGANHGDHGDGHAHGEHSSPSQGEDGPSAHCGPCVACCAAASIAPASRTFELQSSPNAAIAAPRISLPGALPDKLDRPPLPL